MSVQIEIDQALCSGYANCVALAPDVFDVDPETNTSHLRPGHPMEADDEDVLDAMASCPARAIILMTDPS